MISSEIEGDVCYKIGYTKRDPKKRLKELKTGNASDLSVIETFQSKWGTQIEARLHNIFDDKKISGEWFKLSDEDIKNFKNLCQLMHNNLELLADKSIHFQSTTIYKKFN
jgi:hypothetical protein